jgi:hypothetical protein
MIREGSRGYPDNFDTEATPPEEGAVTLAVRGGVCSQLASGIETGLKHSRGLICGAISAGEFGSRGEHLRATARGVRSAMPA